MVAMNYIASKRCIIQQYILTDSLFILGKYPVYDSCEELFKAGISLSGNYSLKNGSHHCLFYGN